MEHSIKQNSLLSMGVPEEETAKEAESLFKDIMTENIPILGVI